MVESVWGVCVGSVWGVCGMSELRSCNWIVYISG